MKTYDTLSPPEAAEVAASIRDRFQFVGDVQERDVGRLLMRRFPTGYDAAHRTAVESAKAMLFAVAANARDGRLILSEVNTAISNELRRRGLPSGDTRQYAETRAGWSEFGKKRREESDWADGLSETEVEEFTAIAMSLIPPDARPALKGRTVRTSTPLCGLAFEYAKAQGAFR